MPPPDAAATPELVLDPAATVLAPAAETTVALRRRGLGVGAWLSIVWLVAIVLAAVLAPVLPLPDPLQSSVELKNAGPSLDHLLGGDGLGHDVLAQVVWGGRTSLVVGFGAILFGTLTGGFLGLVSGYYRGRLESVLVGAFDVMLAFPQLVLALAIVAFLGNSARNVIAALAIVSTPILARITRANTLTWSQREFVLAARTLGARNPRIMVREVLPNVLPAMLSIALLGVAVVIVAEGGLSLLGVGVQSVHGSWGVLIATARNDLDEAPWAVFGPSGAIFLTVLALNYLGDVVRSRFDVRGSAL
ncbi:MAG TPA: ABC transporter permease [Acidimicrobiales bacterium]|jgi:peptide/nickel transport system permease protein